jgi:hypothetical protein
MRIAELDPLVRPSEVHKERRVRSNGQKPRSKAAKRVAKQKAKRSAKRSLWSRLHSKDPAIRLQQVDKLPVVQALAGSRLWDDGIGYMFIARQESTGGLIFALFLVDVFCLGVKNAFWRAGSRSDLDDFIEHLETSQKMRAITPACLVKIVKGALEYAQSFGFVPHPDYRHASILLDGIDPSNCPNQFEFGRPFYIQGPNESLAQATAISQRIERAEGHFILKLSGPDPDPDQLSDTEDGFDDLDSTDADDSPDGSA